MIKGKHNIAEPQLWSGKTSKRWKLHAEQTVLQTSVPAIRGRVDVRGTWLSTTKDDLPQSIVNITAIGRYINQRQALIFHQFAGFE